MVSDYISVPSKINSPIDVCLTGDYITIYQFQRGVMKQQAREQELELASLRHEREEMKDKLKKLQVWSFHSSIIFISTELNCIKWSHPVVNIVHVKLK